VSRAACARSALRLGRAGNGRFTPAACGRRWRERGQGVVEYSLILVLASIAVATAVGAFGDALLAHYDDIIEAIASL